MAGFDNTAYWVFVDECGTVSPKDPSSNLYIEAAVLVKDEDKENLSNSIDEICQDLFGGTELKNSKIAGKNDKRLSVLKRIEELPFQFIALICNKDLIDKDSGLQYKQSCYKFLHKKLHNIFYLLPGNIHFVIDNFGNKIFEEGAKKYFSRESEELFHAEPFFDYVNDKTDRLIQLADFIAGTLLYCFDPTRKDAQYVKLFRPILKKHEIDLYCYPRLLKPVSDTPLKPEDNQFAADLRDRLYNQAQNFIDRNEDNEDEIIQMQWHTLKRLFDASEYEDDSDRYIYADTLIQHLLDDGWTIGKRNFTVDVIGGLRRNNIIIAGSPIGYKLALSIDDVNEYLEHDKKIILPMLDKLSKARKNILMLMKYDILQSPEYKDLNILINALSENNLSEYAKMEEYDIDSASSLNN